MRAVQVAKEFIDCGDMIELGKAVEAAEEEGGGGGAAMETSSDEDDSDNEIFVDTELGTFVSAHPTHILHHPPCIAWVVRFQQHVLRLDILRHQPCRQATAPWRRTSVQDFRPRAPCLNERSKTGVCPAGGEEGRGVEGAGLHQPRPQVRLQGAVCGGVARRVGAVRSHDVIGALTPPPTTLPARLCQVRLATGVSPRAPMATGVALPDFISVVSSNHQPTPSPHPQTLYHHVPTKAAVNGGSRGFSCLVDGCICRLVSNSAWGLVGLACRAHV